MPLLPLRRCSDACHARRSRFALPSRVSAAPCASLRALERVAAGGPAGPGGPHFGRDSFFRRGSARFGGWDPRRIVGPIGERRAADFPDGTRRRWDPYRGKDPRIVDGAPYRAETRGARRCPPGGGRRLGREARATRAGRAQCARPLARTLPRQRAGARANASAPARARSQRAAFPRGYADQCWDRRAACSAWRACHRDAPTPAPRRAGRSTWRTHRSAAGCGTPRRPPGGSPPASPCL